MVTHYTVDDLRVALGFAKTEPTTRSRRASTASTAAPRRARADEPPDAPPARTEILMRTPARS